MSRDRAAVRMYGALVRLYPRRFREEYGPDLVGLFRDQCEDESVTRACGRAAVDLVITIPTQHLEAKMHRSSRTLVPLLFTALAVAGFVVAIIGGSFLPTIVIGLAIAFGAGAAAIAAWRRNRVAPSTLTASWWKFLVVAAVLIGAANLGSALGIEAWALLMLTLLTAFVCIAIGLGLGVARLLDRRRPDEPPVSFSSGAS
jgi:hypothetical protein